ncbi:hypothetical protein DCMF_13325 [Candidatus Formimonas warabiya]|uniref:Membrane dipeptidase n=2 Tax=Formimonas warabiya TaxID=1761012 RepID=A0A3G1KT20_FORW1|nr:hypothetical protein DCMF_13325 [Candidatus Formimonas warabiya]
MEEAYMKDYLEIHNKALVIDGHTDIPFDLLCTRNLEVNKFKGDEGADTLRVKHFPMLNQGNVNIVFANMFAEIVPEGSLRQVLLQLEDLIEQLEKSEGKLICTKSDLEEVIAQKKIGMVLSLEGLEPLGKDLILLPLFYRLGVRSAMLTWNRRNYFASGCADTGGLSTLGKQAIREMERLGMIIDVSHLNEEGFWDIMDIAVKPVIASHSNARALYNHPRNLTDDQIKAIVDTGGVIGLNSMFTADHDRHSLATCLEHLEYMINFAGNDHVGLGLDFNGYLPYSVYPGTPGLEEAGKIPSITKELVQRGYDETTIKKILGENFLRILNNVLP